MSDGRPSGRRTGVEAEWLPVWLPAGIRDMGSTGRSERGAGSVFYDKSSKRWVVMVSLPRIGDGKRRRSRRTFRTKSEAMVFLAGGPAGALERGDDSSALRTCGTSHGAPCGRTGRRSGLKKQKGRPRAAANDDDEPFLPHLFFRCRIVGGISADFFKTPSPEGGRGCL
jgi:hypothetical protein